MPYQIASEKKPDRTDHVWWFDRKRNVYKCVLCGGITRSEPPSYPTAKDWLPEDREALTDDDRARSPNPHKGTR